MAYSPRWNIFDRIYDSDTRVRVIDDVANSRTLIEIDGATVATFNGDGLTLASGASINEFSTDGTLVGNSDDAVPTEQAVKTYVDNQFASLTSDRITQDDSKVQVVDDGTNAAYVEVVIDSVTVGTWASDGLTLASGTAINEFSTDGTLSGDSDDAIPTEAAVKTYVDTEIGNIPTDAISEGDSYVEVVDTGEGYVTTVIDGSEVIHTDAESTVFSQDVSISGDLFVDGTTFVVHNKEVTTSDNIIVVNQGETGPGVTKGTAGLEVDRGTEPNYQFIFSEDTDTFRIGEVGDTQAVATREDTPTNLRVPWWNDTQKRFDTAGEAYITIDNVLDEVTMASGDSYIRIGDDGTHVGYVEIVTNGRQVARFDPSSSTQRIGKTDTGRIEIADAQVAVSFGLTTTAMTLTASGVSLQNGTSVNEFSTDITLGGDSDNAIPTERAVKTYVDNQFASLASDQIISDDTYVKCVDDGTHVGYVEIVADGVQVSKFDSQAESIRIGKESAAGQVKLTDQEVYLSMGDPNGSPGAYIQVQDSGETQQVFAEIPGGSTQFAIASGLIIGEISGSVLISTTADNQYLGDGANTYIELDESGTYPVGKFQTAGGQLTIDDNIYSGFGQITFVSNSTNYMTMDPYYQYIGSSSGGNYLQVSTGGGEDPQGIHLYGNSVHVFEATATGATYVRGDLNNFLEIYPSGEGSAANIDIDANTVLALTGTTQRLGQASGAGRVDVSATTVTANIGTTEVLDLTETTQRLGTTTEGRVELTDRFAYLKSGNNEVRLDTDIYPASGLYIDISGVEWMAIEDGANQFARIGPPDSATDATFVRVTYPPSASSNKVEIRVNDYNVFDARANYTRLSSVDNTSNRIDIYSDGEGAYISGLAGGTEVIKLEETTQRLGTSGDTFITLNSSTDSIQIQAVENTYIGDLGNEYLHIVAGAAPAFGFYIADSPKLYIGATASYIGDSANAARIDLNQATNTITGKLNNTEVLDLTATVQRLGVDGDTYLSLSSSGDSALLRVANNAVLNANLNYTYLSSVNVGNRIQIYSDGEGAYISGYAGNTEVIKLEETTQRLGQASGAGRVDVSATEVTASIGTTEVLDLTELTQRIGVSTDTYLTLSSSGDYALLRVANNNILNANLNYTVLSSVDNGNQIAIYSDAEGAYINARLGNTEVIKLEETTQRLGQASGAGRITTTDTDISAYVNTRPILDANEDRINLGDDSEAYITIDQTANTIIVSESSVVAATFTEFGVTLTSGATVNEFSTDGTLAGNSDSAVPTEKAVKTYVDAQITTVNRNVRLVSSDTTGADDDIILVDTTAGDVNIDLLEGSATQVTIKKITSDSNSIIVSTTPGTIDGAASKTISTNNESYTFVSDGTDFYII